MERVTVRDANAQQLAQQLTRKTVTLVPDPALLLAPAAAETTRQWLQDNGVPLDGRPLIGVAARRWFPPQARIIPNRVKAKLSWSKPVQQPQADRLTTLLAQVLDHAVRRHNAYVLFLPTYTLSHEGDDQVCREILSKMTLPAGQVLAIEDPRLYKGCTGHLTAFLGGRMHPMIFAAAMGTPVVGLAYNQKFQGFFQLLQNDRLMDVATFVEQQGAQELVRLLDAAVTEKAVEVFDPIEVLTQQVRAFNRQLLRDYC
jgi:polysaccharide pyruvyl transferase WcaK-like protein